jgi:hypothetical protein
MATFTSRDLGLLQFLLSAPPTPAATPATIRPERDNRYVSRPHRAYNRPRIRRETQQMLAYIGE